MTTEWLRRFVQAWYESKNIDDVGREMGVDRRGASNHAATLRRHGVVLPKQASAVLNVGGRRIPETPPDWEALRRFAEACKAVKEIQKYRG